MCYLVRTHWKERGKVFGSVETRKGDCLGIFTRNFSEKVLAKRKKRPSYGNTLLMWPLINTDYSKGWFHKFHMCKCVQRFVILISLTTNSRKTFFLPQTILSRRCIHLVDRCVSLATRHM